MLNIQTISTVALRLLLGWYMFFAGIEKVLDPNWSAANFLLNAKTFPDFYAWFATPTNLLWIDPLNAWGITLVGVALLLGIGIRPAAFTGAFLMAIYYFPHYVFPSVPHGFIVEDHIIYAVAFVFVAVAPHARLFALSHYLQKSALGRIPYIRALL